MRHLLSVAIATSLCACSLVVDGIEPPTCETSTQCAVLNELEGINPDGCELYQCSQARRCELQVRDNDADGRIAPECASSPLANGAPIDCNDDISSSMEVCNGIDDDCDAIIDEQYMVEGVTMMPLPSMPAATIASIGASTEGSIGFGESSGALAMAHAESNAAIFALRSGATTVGPTPMSYRRANTLASFDAQLDDGCHVLNMAGDPVDGGCNFGELDLGLTTDNVFAAVVSENGCGVGQLRVGYFERADAAQPAVIQRGPARRSNVFLGVDVAIPAPGTLACTGASRASGVLGAARPSVAAMDLTGGEDQALAAWIADTVQRPECGGTAADVEALALHVQIDVFGQEHGWVTASDEGTPQVLGRTSQGGAIAVAVWENTGYLVGFGDAGGGLRLVFVEMAPAAPGFDRDGAVDDRTGLETEPFRIVDLGVMATDAAVNDVAIALGSIRSGGIDAGVTWREGCGGGGERIFFRQIFVESAGAAIDEARSFDVVELASAPRAGAPAIAYTFRGMIAPNAMREDGGPMVTEQNDGGWIVAWPDASMQDPGPADDSRVLARRISEADGTLLGDEVIALGAIGDVRRTRPALYRDDDDRIHYAFFELGGENPGFAGAPLTCIPEG
jgi:hypothetical protein